MQKEFVVAIGRDASLMTYCRPDLIVTINRFELQGQYEVIAFNDFVEGNIFLPLYDTDLMNLLDGKTTQVEQRISAYMKHPRETIEKFQQYVYEKIEAMAGNRKIVINPYFNAYTGKMRERGFEIVGPSDDLAHKYARKVVAYELGQKTGVPVPEGMIVKNLREAIQFFKQCGSACFVASDDDPYYPTNFFVKSIDDFENKPEIAYLITKWMANSQSANSQILIGGKEIVYLGLSDQIIKHETKYYGNICPSILNEANQKKIEKYSLVLGKAMQADGLVGVVGFDWIENEKGEIFFIEINPRKNRSSSVLLNFLSSQNKNIFAYELAATRGDTIKDLKTEVLENIHWGMELFKSSAKIFIKNSLSEQIAENEFFSDIQGLRNAIYNWPLAGSEIENNLPDLARIVVSAGSREAVLTELEKSKNGIKELVIIFLK